MRDSDTDINEFHLFKLTAAFRIHLIFFCNHCYCQGLASANLYAIYLLDTSYLKHIANFHAILLQEELETHDGVSKGKYTIGLGQDSMAFCTEVEDVISMRYYYFSEYLVLLLSLFFVFFTSFFISCITLAPSPYGCSFFFFDLLIMCICICTNLSKARTYCKTAAPCHACFQAIWFCFNV